MNDYASLEHDMSANKAVINATSVEVESFAYGD